MSLSQQRPNRERAQYVRERNSMAPIYIPIGPQCAGKTTKVNSIRNENKELVDITIDDQCGVYIKIPTELFLRHNINMEDDHGRIDTSFLESTLHGKSIRERIYDDSNLEMRLITQRLSGKISREEFRSSIMAIDGNSTSDSSHVAWQNLLRKDGQVEESSETHCWKTFLVNTVEKEVEEEFSLSHVDLFVVERIFKPISNHCSASSFVIDGYEERTRVELPKHLLNETKSQSGLNAVSSKLKHLAMDDSHGGQPLSWGNTNAKSGDYVTALEVAQNSGRPIHFVPYSGTEILQSLYDSDELDMHLPRVGIKILLKRNIQRFKSTGRFIPTKAIIVTSERVDVLMQQAISKMKYNARRNYNSDKESHGKHSKFELDRALASLASFGMKNDRTVYKFQGKRSNNGGRGYNEGNRKRGASYEQRDGRGTYGRGRGAAEGRGRGRGTAEGRGRGRGRGRGQQYSNDRGLVEGRERGRGRGRGYSNGGGRGPGRLWEPK